MTGISFSQLEEFNELLILNRFGKLRQDRHLKRHFAVTVDPIQTTLPLITGKILSNLPLPKARSAQLPACQTREIPNKTC